MNIIIVVIVMKKNKSYNKSDKLSANKKNEHTNEYGMNLNYYNDIVLKGLDIYEK